MSTAWRCRFTLVEEGAAREFGAEKNILLDGQLWNEREFLKDRD